MTPALKSVERMLLCNNIMLTNRYLCGVYTPNKVHIEIFIHIQGCEKSTFPILSSVGH